MNKCYYCESDSFKTIQLSFPEMEISVCLDHYMAYQS